MFKLIKSILLLLCLPLLTEGQNHFTDNRDGKTYLTIKIGEQTWFAENLSYKTAEGCWTYNDNENNVETYGRLYNWETARQACPEGWHLPTDNEWKELESFIGLKGEEVNHEGYRGEENSIGDLLKIDSLKINPKLKDTGFNIVFAGCRHDFVKNCTGLSQNTYFWADKNNDENQIPGRRFRKEKSGIYRSTSYHKEDAYSVRCIKNQAK